MKGLKLGIITILTIVFVGNVSAQDSKGQWAISAGVNIVDVRGGDDFCVERWRYTRDLHHSIRRQRRMCIGDRCGAVRCRCEIKVSAANGWSR